MGIEQNLDEMIKSLQRSVDDLSEAENPVSDNSEDYTDISTSDLQKILEEKYFSEGATGNHETDGNYELDDEVLAQFYEENAEEELEEELKSELEEEPLAVFGEDDLSDLIQNEIGDINETLPEDIEALEDNELLEQLASESLTEQTEALDPFEDAEKDEFAEQTESI